MLWAIAIVFLLLWALGLVTSYTLGGFIHVLVGIAVALLFVRIIRGRRRLDARQWLSTTLGTPMSDRRLEGQGAPANEEPDQSPSDRVLATWEDEGGSTIVPPDETDERNRSGSTSPSSVEDGSKRSGISRTPDPNTTVGGEDDHKAAFPPETADRFTKLFGRFLKIEAAAGAALLVATCAALILSNSGWSAAFLSAWELACPGLDG